MTDTGKYDAVARSLHWLIALAIVVQVVLGLGHEPWEHSFPAAMPIHKALGMTVLVLSLFRLIWRLGHTPPPLPATLPRWQISAAKAVHWLFYFMMIAVPVTGWIFSSAGKYPLSWFGMFDLPKLPVVKGDAIVDPAHEAHEILGLLFIPLIALHIAAAFYHTGRDRVLQRML